MLSELPIETLPATSVITIKRLGLFNIKTYWDLLNHFPFRYENYSKITHLCQLKDGETVSVKGIVEKLSQNITKRGFRIQKVTIADGTGSVDLIWFNQKYLLTLLKQGMHLAVSGTVKQFGRSFSIEPTSYEILKTPDQETIHTGRIIPIYPEKQALSSKTIREKMMIVLRTLNENLEWLPQDIVKKNGLMEDTEAYREVHFPKSLDTAKEARRRLAFDELFTMQLSAALVKKSWEQEQVTHAFSLKGKNKKLLDSFIKQLPFELTNAQKQVTDDILNDLTQTKPMNRFVQGDVGSGKTVVAAIAAYISYLNGFQTLIMAPTEILAQQHFATISKLFAKFALEDSPLSVGELASDRELGAPTTISSSRGGNPLEQADDDSPKRTMQGMRIGLQTGATKSIKKSKKTEQEQFDILIGTHALLTNIVQLDKVGLVVIDEQHRFGVAQRATLKNKGTNPHLLTMTATPIPRTVALTMYGELDLSVINEMPKGRLPIKTHLVPHSKRADGYEWIKKQIDELEVQGYIICPLVEESEQETMASMRAATKEYEHLQKNVFKKYKVALLHGKMKAKEKAEVMQDFKDKKYDILVSTSVVEVGIDVPNATIMIIEGAERFGLAQLHQLRGRVGRGDKQSYCFLYTSNEDTNNLYRLKFFAKTLSGMELSEFDLKIRGQGQIYGTSQSGHEDLKIASFSDFNLISQTKQAVTDFIKHNDIIDYPEMQKRVEKYQVSMIGRD